MFKEMFLDLTRELRASGDVEITRLELKFSDEAEPSPEYLSSLFTKSFGFDLPLGLEELLTFPPECAAAWRYKSKDEFVEGGEFRLVNLFDAFDSSRVKIDPDAIPTSVRGKPHEAVYFDSQPEIGNRIHTLLLEDRKGLFPSVYLQDNDRVLPMVVDVAQYVRLLAVSKGFYYWQYLFCDIDLRTYELGYQRSCIRNMMIVLRRLFPDSDLGLLEKRSDEMHL
jgi:hypothetical protein